ncbi:MAG: rod shape-determining protein MreC [Lachnospiraceae bacterium]|nr:rod shape-determining protein MreC [Lachnospiraceae bacterium]
MNKKDSQFQPKHIFLILVIVCVLLLILSSVSSRINSRVRSTINTVLMPMQNGMNKIGGFISDKAEEISELKDVRDRNEDLEDELAYLRMEVAKYQLQEKELDSYKELLDMKDEYPDYPTIGAHIIGENSTNWNKTVLIDRGANDGISVNMNVIAQGGLVGIVTAVYSNSATVRTIIDHDCMVGGMSVISGDSCIVRGDLEIYEEGMLILEKMEKDADIYDDYKIVTDNKSSLYLPGILIGYAKNITGDSNSLTKSGYLTPVVDFSHLDSVLVITQLKENGED